MMKAARVGCQWKDEDVKRGTIAGFLLAGNLGLVDSGRGQWSVQHAWHGFKLVTT